MVDTNNNTAGVLAAPTGATITLIDDNSYGLLQFSSPSYQVNEKGGHITIPVIRTGGSAQNLTVNFTTADGPLAFSSTNYVTTSNTLIFHQGEVAKTFDVPILDDGVTNGPPFTNFYFNVNLLATAPPGMLGYQTNSRVYIVDAETFNWPAGSVDTFFAPNPGFNGDVYSVGLQTNGQIVAAGAFSIVNNYPRNSIARLNTDGSIDAPPSSMGSPAPMVRSRRYWCKAMAAFWRVARSPRSMG